MCSPIGWAGKVSESVRFRTKINTILADDHFGISAPLACDGAHRKGGPYGWELSVVHMLGGTLWLRIIDGAHPTGDPKAANY